MHSFSELIIGDVFVAPFIAYAVAALAMFLALRPILHLCGFDKLFSNAGLAELSLYVTILGLLTIAF
jgi:protein AaeX